METSTHSGEIKQVKVIFSLNVLMVVYAATTFIKSVDDGVLWKIICSGIGVNIFLLISVLLFLRLKKLQS